jgi:hypothetical protein
MTTLLITLAVIVGLFVLVCVLAGIAALYDRIFYPHGHEVSPEQVRAELQRILDGVDPYAIDDFTSGSRLKDPRLEAIRQRVAQLDAEFPPESKGQYCGSKGIEVIRGYVRELEHETAG